MLSLLKIKNIALIDEIEIEFSAGLNLLTGETGSGKSIIVDSLGALTGDRVSSDLVKEGAEAAKIEGLFVIKSHPQLLAAFDESGIELEKADELEIIIRRELSLSGKNRIFVNNQLATQSFLKKIGEFLVDIHGQGEQATLFNPATHLEMLDQYAGLGKLREKLAEKYSALQKIKKEVAAFRQDQTEKLQLLDVLRFQTDEIGRANLAPFEDDALEEEKRRLNNIEKLSALSGEAFAELYEKHDSTLSTLDKALKDVRELSEFEPGFGEYREGLDNARAVLEDLAISLRDYKNKLEFSPARLEEIENRLVEITGLKRKYGGTIESVLEHFSESEQRLKNIESSELREKELETELKKAVEDFVVLANEASQKRKAAAAKLEKAVGVNFKAVALEKAKLEVKITADSSNPDSFTSKGFDSVEFYFSANPGESPKPIAKVASGGEASRLMLVLKTTATALENPNTAVFDEIDAGVGGRVAEAVGLKLKELSAQHQVLCVTHQAQVAALADHHFVVTKETDKKRAVIGVAELADNERIEEIARMLTGAQITETAREHAKELLSKRESAARK